MPAPRTPRKLKKASRTWEHYINSFPVADFNTRPLVAAIIPELARLGVTPEEFLSTPCCDLPPELHDAASVLQHMVTLQDFDVAAQ